MTIRAYLKRRFRRSNILIGCGIALVVVAGWLSAVLHSTWLLVVALLGFVLAVAAGISHLFLHCPKCGGGFGLPPAQFGNPFGPEMRFCPYCGVSLDTQLDETPKV